MHVRKLLHFPEASKWKVRNNAGRDLEPNLKKQNKKKPKKISYGKRSFRLKSCKSDISLYVNLLNLSHIIIVLKERMHRKAISNMNNCQCKFYLPWSMLHFHNGDNFLTKFFLLKQNVNNIILVNDSSTKQPRMWKLTSWR